MLVTSPLGDAAAFVPVLREAVAAADIAAVILQFAESDERMQINAAKTLAKIVQEKEAALLLHGRHELVARAGADGAHLSGLDDFNDALAALKPDRIAGAGGMASRHDAMSAAETGADYVMFGEPDAHGERPPLDAVTDRLAWWAEVFEAPCVGYAADLDDIAPMVAAGADFVALDPAVWTVAPGSSLATAAKRLALPETVT